MLTRLKISGFKNLVDVDVRFGPFTCVAGPNGVGKSNLFDAIRFLSALADRPLVDAALSVRDAGGRTSDIRNLFHRVGDAHADRMTFETEMIVPAEATDDLGQKARASITFLRYSLTLGYRAEQGRLSLGSLQVLSEDLVHITQRDAGKHILFPHSVSDWRRDAISGRRQSPLISTGGEGDDTVIKLHQDGGSRGRPLPHLAVSLPRTVLSSALAAESPTAAVARAEMRSWRLLQLEPSALRRPDEFTAPSHMGIGGAHLPATLHRLTRTAASQGDGGDPEEDAQRLYAQIASRLAELIDDVRDLWIERDERRELMTLHVRTRDGTPHPARALSDGTLRFMGLAVLELDPEACGLLCLEEPENGIHPSRIPAMLRLLEDIAEDVEEPPGPDNPLRQVIVNTHSPAVVGRVTDDSLLVAESREAVRDGHVFARAVFSCLPDTWRDRPGGGGAVISRGRLLAYLDPLTREDLEAEAGMSHQAGSSQRPCRVMDRPDIAPLLPFPRTIG